jgi:Enoyl-CoA hydratase/isomerase
MTDMSTIKTEIRGHVLLVGLNRPQKLNAFNEEMLRGLSAAFTRYEADAALRCAVLSGAGKDFTAGLDLASVMPGIEAGGPLWPCEGIDPLAIGGPGRTKPLVTALHRREDRGPGASGRPGHAGLGARRASRRRGGRRPSPPGADRAPPRERRRPRGGPVVPRETRRSLHREVRRE